MFFIEKNLFENTISSMQDIFGYPWVLEKKSQLHRQIYCRYELIEDIMKKNINFCPLIIHKFKVI